VSEDLLADVELVDLDSDIPPPNQSATFPLSTIAKIALPALGVAACGGGTAGTSTGAVFTASPINAPPPPPPPPPAITGQQASRFLHQSTMGVTKAEISKVQSVRYEGWLDEQFAMPRAISHWDWLVSKNYNAAANKNTENGFNAMMWRQLIVSPDQLRTRVATALLDFLVVGIDGISTGWNQFAMAAYVDILHDNAFGNYRTLLEKISTSPTMGFYLTFRDNKKANPTTGSRPDENYARELMQLFTLGVNKLNPDGTVQTVNGAAVETYVQDDVSNLARVFTGYELDTADNAIPDRYRRPMINNAANYETGVKTFLGSTIASGTSAQASLSAALDTIFAHPNVPPFISKQLIQRLVTSNPSPAYVGRVSAIFANNGSGVRGDMKAVIRAILLDSEARDDAGLTSQTFGKIRAPVNRLTNWARSFAVNSPSETWQIDNTTSPLTRLAQGPGRSPSVFNFFRPGYTPPNTELATRGLVGPEFQITNEPSVIAYVNYMTVLVGGSGAGDTQSSYSEIITLYNNSQALVDEVNLLLAAGQVSAPTVALIKSAVDAIDASATPGQVKRITTAILLILASPEFIAQK
jgi:uncharacterized protein (DUF1800 family)